MEVNEEIELEGRIIQEKFEILGKIGCGGSAVVYKARCIVTDDIVAIKMLRSDLLDDDDYVNRFRRESQAVASLSHENIVNVLDVGKSRESYFIVMEYIEGQTLKGLIQQNNKIDPESTVFVGSKIAQGIKHAHDNQVIHRDIKPQNILIGADGKIKVADFGIARTSQSTTIIASSQTVLGSVHYLSPEQAKGQYADLKSDIYSFGITLYEMVTGTVPFKGDNPVAIALKHINEIPIPPIEIEPAMPRSLSHIIVKCLEKEPRKRYQDMSEVLSDLDRALEDTEGSYVIRNIDESFHTQRLSVVNNEKVNTGIKKRPLKLPIFAASFLVLLIIGIMFFVNSMYRQTVAQDEVIVPPLVGLQIEEAQAILGNLDLTFRVISRVHSTDFTNGTIISTNVPETGRVSGSFRVDAVISLGKRDIAVPNIIGLNIADAQALLDGIGISEILLEEATSNFPVGTVLSQSMPKDTIIEIDTILTIVVSSGPEFNVMQLRNYVGLALEIAEAHIINDGLNVGNVVEEYSLSIPANTVIRQLPIEGGQVRENQNINLWVSRGPQPMRTKNIQIFVPETVGANQFELELLRESDSSVVYTGLHLRTDGNIEIPITDRGVVTYLININGVQTSEVTVDFTLEEGD